MNDIEIFSLVEKFFDFVCEARGFKFPHVVRAKALHDIHSSLNWYHKRYRSDVLFVFLNTVFAMHGIVPHEERNDADSCFPRWFVLYRDRICEDTQTSPQSDSWRDSQRDFFGRLDSWIDDMVSWTDKSPRGIHSVWNALRYRPALWADRTKFTALTKEARNVDYSATLFTRLSSAVRVEPEGTGKVGAPVHAGKKPPTRKEVGFVKDPWSPESWSRAWIAPRPKRIREEGEEEELPSKKSKVMDVAPAPLPEEWEKSSEEPRLTSGNNSPSPNPVRRPSWEKSSEEPRLTSGNNSPSPNLVCRPSWEKSSEEPRLPSGNHRPSPNPVRRPSWEKSSEQPRLPSGNHRPSPNPVHHPSHQPWYHPTVLPAWEPNRKPASSPPLPSPPSGYVHSWGGHSVVGSNPPPKPLEAVKGLVSLDPSERLFTLAKDLHPDERGCERTLEGAGPGYSVARSPPSFACDEADYVSLATTCRRAFFLVAEALSEDPLSRLGSCHLSWLVQSAHLSFGRGKPSSVFVVNPLLMKTMAREHDSISFRKRFESWRNSAKVLVFERLPVRRVISECTSFFSSVVAVSFFNVQGSLRLANGVCDSLKLNCPRLKSLALINCSEAFSRIPEAVPEGLRSLKVVQCGDLDGVGKWDWKKLRGLVHLSVVPRSFAGPSLVDSLFGLARDNCPALRGASFPVPGSTSILRSFPLLTHLELVGMGGHNRVTHANRCDLAAMPELRRLSLVDCSLRSRCSFDDGLCDHTRRVCGTGTVFASRMRPSGHFSNSAKHLARTFLSPVPLGVDEVRVLPSQLFWFDCAARASSEMGISAEDETKAKESAMWSASDGMLFSGRPDGSRALGFKVGSSSCGWPNAERLWATARERPPVEDPREEEELHEGPTDSSWFSYRHFLI